MGEDLGNGTPKQLFVTFEKPRTVQQFLALFYKDGYAGTTLKKNLINGTLINHCNFGKDRSFDDLYILLKTYYPSLTRVKIFEHLIKFRGYADTFTKKQVKFQLHLSNCSNIRRVKFYKHFIHEPFINEYNIKSTANHKMIGKYNSKWSWKELIEELGDEKFIELYNN